MSVESKYKTGDLSHDSVSCNHALNGLRHMVGRYSLLQPGKHRVHGSADDTKPNGMSDCRALNGVCVQ